MEHAIPETDSGADGIASGCFCLCLPHRIAAAKLVQHNMLSGPWIPHPFGCDAAGNKERWRLLLCDLHAFAGVRGTSME